jgi:chemotaxis signal transduction protein
MRTIVSFRCGGRHYGVGIERVQRVLDATGLVPLPDPQPGVAGLLAHDGDTVTVLAPFDRGDGQPGQVLVLDHHGAALGLLVDAVTSIGRVDDPAVGPPPTGQRSPLVSGVVRRGGEDGEELLLLLDVDALAGELRP